MIIAQRNLRSYFSAPELKPSQIPKKNPERKQASNGAGKFPTGHAFEIVLPNLIHKSKTLLCKATEEQRAKFSAFFFEKIGG
ncbi:MAG: hypothetical protein AAB857_02935 [Patescibacteria group bacterium]